MQKNIKKLLFIGPLPYPIDGQSKATKMSLFALKQVVDEIEIVDTNRRTLNRSMFVQIRRVFVEFPPLLMRIIYQSRGSNYVYISISESILGNIKDLFVYLILYKKLKRTIIHMLGGSGMNIILNERPILSRINKFFFKKIMGVVVEGSRGVDIFSKHVDKSKIHIVPNFVDEYLQTDAAELNFKLSKLKKLNILYLSNMIVKKGYLDLLESYQLLSLELRNQINLTFVGGFPDEKARVDFLYKIKYDSNVNYLGSFIDGIDKKKLYLDSHIFCLPTYYPYEGQPISILEAYATGCVVLTTKHGGIEDIFIDGYNGFYVEPQNPKSIGICIKECFLKPNLMSKIADNNIKTASSMYKEHIYRQKIQSIFVDHQFKINI